MPPARKDRSRTPPRKPPPKPTPLGSKAASLGAPRDHAVGKTCAPGSRRGVGRGCLAHEALPPCCPWRNDAGSPPATPGADEILPRDCHWKICPPPSTAIPMPDRVRLPKAMSQTTTMQGLEFPPTRAAVGAAPGRLTLAASGAPGGSIPNTPRPEPAELPLGSSHTETVQTVELGPQGEMITVVTTKTTIITKAPGVKASSSKE